MAPTLSIHEQRALGFRPELLEIDGARIATVAAFLDPSLFPSFELSERI